MRTVEKECTGTEQTKEREADLKLSANFTADVFAKLSGKDYTGAELIEELRLALANRGILTPNLAAIAWQTANLNNNTTHPSAATLQKALEDLLANPAMLEFLSKEDHQNGLNTGLKHLTGYTQNEIHTHQLIDNQRNEVNESLCTVCQAASLERE